MHYILLVGQNKIEIKAYNNTMTKQTCLEYKSVHSPMGLQCIIDGL